MATKRAGRTRAAKTPTRPAAPSAPRTQETVEARIVTITINGKRRDFRELDPTITLAYLLRELCGFTGLKVACDEGACGGCTVLLDGEAVLSCMVLAVEAHGHEVLTIEGLPEDDPVVTSFAEQCEPGYGTALQCGICTPGFVMTATALLREHPSPTVEQIKEGLSGNLCRCGCYSGIAQAVYHASEKLADRGGDR